MQPFDGPGLAAGTVVGGYKIVRLLGFGGMGAVYEAVHPIIGKRAAVKVIQAHAASSKSGIERFIQEARLVNQIRHPAIVDVFGFDALPDGRPVLVMELLEGETLGQMLARRSRLTAHEAIAVMLPVLGALAAAHEAGVIHRDLKPENLFIVRGSTKVLDFGIAKLIDAPPGSGMTSVTGGQLGTPKYMSPEQCRGEAIDGRSDLYAIGLILFELLAGRGPFGGGSPAEFLGQHLYADPTRLSTYVMVDPRLEDVVMRLLHKDRTHRPESARELEHELRSMQSVISASAATEAVAVMPSRPSGGVVITAASGSPPATRPSASPGPVLINPSRASVPAPPPEAISSTNSVEENRLCTILFADVSGFTALSERLPPEEVKEIIDGCFAAMTAVIEKHGGYVDKYIGDCVMAVFGVPRSTDNDAERAVHAALKLQQTVAKYGLRGRRHGRLRLSLRIGINTGRVFAGRVGGANRKDFTVMGDAVNIASRLQAHAPEAAIVVGRDTYRHITGLFSVEELPAVIAKGKTEPLVCYRVLGQAAQRAVPQDEFYGATTSFVGRRADLERLLDLLEQSVADRRAHLVTIVGAAGAGKTRLRDELQRAIEARPERAFILSGRGSHLTREGTYDLASSLLRNQFHINADDPSEVIEQKLRNGIRAFGRSNSVLPPALSTTGAEETNPSLSTPASITPFSARRASGLDPAQLGDAVETLAKMLGAEPTSALTTAGESVDDPRARTSAAFAKLLSLVATRGPVILFCDGLEAADDGSLDLLDYLLVRLADAPVFIVGAARVELYERRPHWGEGKEGHTRMNLAPLPRRALEELARDLLRRAPGISPDFVKRLVERADGNPLVLKETIRVLVDAGGVERSFDDVWKVNESRLEALALPPTIYGLVQARLDRLPPEVRAMVQRAAVVGRVFWEGALDAMRSGTLVEGISTRDLLERLRANDIVRIREGSTFPGEREYVFADSVTREVAYESLSIRAREQYHRAIAGWLETRGNVVVESNPALIAFHWDRASVPREAIKHYARAGHRAAVLGHNADAIRHYTRACTIADAARGAGMPEGSGFDLSNFEELRVVDWQDRVKLRLALGDTLRRVGKLEEAERAYEEGSADIVRDERRKDRTSDANEISRLEGSIELRLGNVEKVRGAFDDALLHYRIAFDKLGKEGDPRYLAPLWAAIGFAQYRTGKLDDALASFRRGLQACRRIPRAEPDWADSASRLLHSMGNVFYQRGKWVQAERLGMLAGRVVDESRFPQLAAIAYNNVAAVAFMRNDYARARELFVRSLELKEKVGDLYDLVVAYNNLAEVSLILGEVEPALDMARRALSLAEALGARDALPDTYRNYAEALRARGDSVGAVRAAEKAFELSLEPAGRAYLQSVATTLTNCCESARSGCTTLDPDARAYVDAAITRTLDRVPRELESAGLGKDAATVRARLSA